jgi:hypothetical protein
VERRRLRIIAGVAFHGAAHFLRSTYQLDQLVRSFGLDGYPKSELIVKRRLSLTTKANADLGRRPIRRRKILISTQQASKAWMSARVRTEIMRRVAKPFKRGELQSLGISFLSRNRTQFTTLSVCHGLAHITLISQICREASYKATGNLAACLFMIVDDCFRRKKLKSMERRASVEPVF